MLTKDAKLTEKIGRKHRTNLNSLTKATNALTVQAITEPTIVQQDTNHRQTPLATLLTVQVFTKIIQFQNTSPQQHLQQSASTVSISTPTLMVNNQPLQTGPQGQQWQPSPQVPHVSQQANFPIRPHQFNQHFRQPPVLQVNPLMAPPQQYNPQIPPPYFH